MSNYHYSNLSKKHSNHWFLRSIAVIILLVIGFCLILNEISPTAFNALVNDVKHNALSFINLNDSTKNDSVKNDIKITPIKPIRKDSLISKSVITTKNITEIPITIGDGNLIYINAKLNSVPIKFILDTGCSDIQITNAELYYLKHNGLISDNDYVGVCPSTDANGVTKNLPIFKIKDLQIGNKEIHNVECTINDNDEAPLLIGQSILAKLGNIKIDYKNKKIIIS